MLARALLLLALASPAVAGPLALPPDDYGRQLVSKTYAFLGPEVDGPALRYAGNNLACANCHLDAGTRPQACRSSASSRSTRKLSRRWPRRSRMASTAA